MIWTVLAACLAVGTSFLVGANFDVPWWFAVTYGVLVAAQFVSFLLLHWWGSDRADDTQTMMFRVEARTLGYDPHPYDYWTVRAWHEELVKVGGGLTTDEFRQACIARGESGAKVPDSATFEEAASHLGSRRGTSRQFGMATDGLWYAAQDRKEISANVKARIRARQ